MTRVVSLATTVAILGCGGSTAPARSTPASSETSVVTTVPPPPTPPAPVLDLSPATYAWGGEEGPLLALDAQGYVSMSAEVTAFLPVPFGHLTDRGELIRDDGTTAATIDDAGLVHIDGRDMGLTIDRNGAAHHRNGKLALAIGEDGTVSGPGGENGDVTTYTESRYEGPLGSRRAILFATIMRTIWLGPDPDPAQVVSSSKAKLISIASCNAFRAKAKKALACVKRDKIWTERLRETIARVEGYAATPPAWGSEATAASCELGATRLTAYFATKHCQL